MLQSDRAEVYRLRGSVYQGGSESAGPTNIPALMSPKLIVLCGTAFDREKQCVTPTFARSKRVLLINQYVLDFILLSVAGRHVFFHGLIDTQILLNEFLTEDVTNGRVLPRGVSCCAQGTL